MLRGKKLEVNTRTKNFLDEIEVYHVYQFFCTSFLLLLIVSIVLFFCSDRRDSLYPFIKNFSKDKIMHVSCVKEKRIVSPSFPKTQKK